MITCKGDMLVVWSKRISDTFLSLLIRDASGISIGWKVWGQESADKVEEMATVGSTIRLQGKLANDSWKDDSGNWHNQSRLIVDGPVLVISHTAETSTRNAHADSGIAIEEALDAAVDAV